MFDQRKRSVIVETRPFRRLSSLGDALGALSVLLEDQVQRILVDGNILVRETLNLRYAIVFSVDNPLQ